MVVLTPKFTVLASVAALSAMVLAPAHGAALPSSPHRTQSSSQRQADQADQAAKFDKHRTPQADGSAASQSSSASDAGSGLPLPIPLPGLVRRLGKVSNISRILYDVHAN